MKLINFNEYKILDTSNGMKLESWKNILLLRPDPVITWDLGDFSDFKINAVYHRSNTGGGHWENKMKTPESWIINYKNLRFLIKEDLTKYDLSSLKHCTTAGEALNAEIYNKFLEATGVKIYEGFGQTETVVALANYPWFEPRPGSLGKPSPSYEIHLLDDNGNDCEEGKAGQIAFKTDERMPYGLFCGYYLDEEKTQSCWHDGYYYTGDIAWCDEDGYYWYVGRADDMIKSSGYRIGPFEVESSLMEHPSVLEVAVTAVPDEIRGQIVKATIVLANGYEGSEELIKELQTHVKNTTAPYKYPRIIEFVESLPKTTSGKIMRTKIRERDHK